MIHSMESPTSVLHFDCYSGLAGDMILAALIDLGLPLSVIESAIQKLPFSGYRIKTTKEKRHAIAATRFVVEVDEGAQPHRHYSDIKKMIEDSELEPAVQKLAIDIFYLIAKAEEDLFLAADYTCANAEV